MHKRTHYLALAFAIGFTALIYEIYSTQVLFLFVPETSRAATIAISSFLAGLACSSLLFSRLGKHDARTNLNIIWYMQIAVALYGFFLLQHYGWIPLFTDILINKGLNTTLLSITKLIFMWVYLFIPAFFIGGSFPLLNGLFLEDIKDGSKDTGLVYFYDTLGSIIGAILAGFLLIPYIGLTWTCLITVGANLVIAIFISTSKKKRIYTGVLLLLLTLLTLLTINGTSLDIMRKRTSNPTFPKWANLDNRFGNIHFQKQSPFGLITIGSGTFRKENDKVLFINYRPMCSSVDHSSESEMASITYANLPENASVLNLGFGCGFTASTIAESPKVRSLDIAEINPIVIEGSKEHFQTENRNVLENPKTNLYIKDGAEHIRNTNKKYDAIIIDIEEPTIIYSSVIYTREYFALAKTKLKPGGILALWAGNGSQEYAKILYNTLKDVYKHVEFRLLDNSSFFTYFASDTNHDFTIGTTDSEKPAIEAVYKNKNSELNTLDNRALEKYYNINTFFDLPADYKEPYIKPRPQ